jgi:hypothetical protein
VIQNVIVGIFDPYQFEFKMGWVYVFVIGVPGGTMLR